VTQNAEPPKVSAKQVIGAEEALGQAIAVRRELQTLFGLNLVDYQLRVSNEIIQACIRGGNNEIPLLWARRSGKTEMLVQTAITLGIYWTHVLGRPFRVGSINPARDEQGVAVTRDRIRERLEKIDPWLSMNGIEKFLDKGRKTEDYILRDMETQAECPFRCISADKSAHVKGAGFHLLLLEQVEEMDETKMRSEIFEMPVGSELVSTRVLAGNPSLEISNHYYLDRTVALEYPFLVDWKTAGRYRPSYGTWVQKESERLGIESDEFRSQFGCEWIQQRNRLTNPDAFRLLQADAPAGMTGQRVGGLDLAKRADNTVLTIGERRGFETFILAWLELEGTNYEQQIDLIVEAVKKWSVATLAVDCTGAGDPVCDMLTGKLRGICQVIPFQFTQRSTDSLYKVYDRELSQGRLHYPKSMSDPEQTRYLTRFVEQQLAAEKEYKTNLLNVRAPDRRGAHDDYCASGALMIYAATQPDRSGLFELRGATRGQ
jgi:hypothetical protein